MKWFRQRQNNSGGYFSGPATEVYVQAESVEQADSRAEEIGLDNSNSCSCCGSRWYGFMDYDSVDELPASVEESICYDPAECPAAMAFPLGDDVGFVLPQHPYQHKTLT